MEVRLCEYEIRMAANVATERQIQSMLNGFRDKQSDKNPWEIHFNGAFGEVAVAKLLNRYYPCHYNDFQIRDVDCFEVRTSNHPVLFCSSKDDDHTPFIYAEVMGMDGKEMVVHIVGWEYAGKVKTNGREVTSRVPNQRLFLMPIEELNPIEELIEIYGVN